MMILKLLIPLWFGFIIGRYLFPIRTKKNYFNVALAILNGTYRDPAYYEVIINENLPTERKYWVKNIKQLDKKDQHILWDAMGPKYDWMMRFFSGYAAQDYVPVSMREATYNNTKETLQ